jgi:hypothetical protein
MGNPERGVVHAERIEQIFPKIGAQLLPADGLDSLSRPIRD